MNFKKTISGILVFLLNTGCDTWQTKSDFIRPISNFDSEKLAYALKQSGWLSTECYFVNSKLDKCFKKEDCFQLIVAPNSAEKYLKITAVKDRGETDPEKCLQEARRIIESGFREKH